MVNMEKQIGFSYGAISKTLREQANEQGFDLKDYEKFEKIKKAINMCMFHVATDSQIKAMTNKLHKQVMNNLIPLE
jgi:hypothetical protein